MRQARAGFVGFGEVNTPRELIERKCRDAEQLLRDMGVELVRTEPVSDDLEGMDVRRALTDLRGDDFDVLVLCVAGWIPTHAVIAIADEFRHKPMLLWGLAGEITEGRLLTTADQAGTAALRKVFEDLGYLFKYVYESPGVPWRKEHILSFILSCRARELLRHARVGMMGYRDMRLHGTMFDGVSLKRLLGVEIEFFEMLEVMQRTAKLPATDVDRTVNLVQESWQFDKPAKPETIRTGVQYYLAIKQKVVERGYAAVSLLDVDGMKRLLGFPPAMIFMLLSEDPGVCTIPENDSLGSVTQLIVRFLTGQVAHYLEFYEFMEDRLLMGVPDFVPLSVVEGPVRVVPSSFGDLGEGLLHTSKVKTGRITMCRLTHSMNGYQMHWATGEAVTPRSWEEAGWRPPAPQLPGLEIILDGPVEEFTQKVLSQHYIIVYGDWTDTLKDFCTLTEIAPY